MNEYVYRIQWPVFIVISQISLLSGIGYGRRGLTTVSSACRCAKMCADDSLCNVVHYSLQLAPQIY